MAQPARAARRRAPNRPVLVLAIAGLVGLLLLVASQRLERPGLIGPGLILFSAGIMGAGAHAVVRRSLYERSSVSPGRHAYAGAAAVLSGLGLLFLGLAIGLVGGAFLIEAEDALLDLATSRPGIVLLTLGLVATPWGAARVLGAREWRGSATRVLAHLPERIGGAVLLLLGAALVGLGAFELLAPEAFHQALAGVMAQAGLTAP